MISAEQAQDLAMEHLGSLDLRGFRYELIRVAMRPQHPGDWTAVFDAFTPDGKPIDGPVVFVINGTTGTVRALGA